MRRTYQTRCTCGNLSVQRHSYDHGLYSGLVHVHGEAFNKKKTANLTTCGRPVDASTYGWPLTGVLLQEPGCQGADGKPNDVINRWAAQVSSAE